MGKKGRILSIAGLGNAYAPGMPIKFIKDPSSPDSVICGGGGRSGRTGYPPYLCPHCHRRFAKGREKTRDHIVPRSRGGGLSYGNKEYICMDCNQLKYTHSLLEFMIWKAGGWSGRWEIRRYPGFLECPGPQKLYTALPGVPGRIIPWHDD